MQRNLQTMAATHHHAFRPESDAEQEKVWEPEEERKLDHQLTHEDQAHEPDHGRHAVDRSRPSSFVRKSH